jgi:dipeptide/tripeptide permease
MWGRYKTILVFSMIYLVGIALLTLSSWPPMGAMPGPDEDPGWWAYTMLCGSLGVIALGTGGWLKRINMSRATSLASLV